MQNNMHPQLQAPQVLEVLNAGVTKTELPNGGMVLTFIVPGIMGYSFVLDRRGRDTVNKLTVPQIAVSGQG